MTTLITHIKQLLGARPANSPLRGRELAELPAIENAYLIIEDGSIADYGTMNAIQNETPIATGAKIENQVDASGQLVMPCWCDSHTHLVYAASREEEFVDKIKGMSYAEIAAKGGGILNSARKLNDTSEDELFSNAWRRLEEVSKFGTGAIEIKSGY